MKKNKDPFSFKPFAKLMFSVNTPPLPSEELDDAYYKRWILLVFGMKKKDFLDKTKDVKMNRELLREILEDENELSDLLYLAVQDAGKIIRARI
jgi:phage/plasmid-associated DNA primase